MLWWEEASSAAKGKRLICEIRGAWSVIKGQGWAAMEEQRKGMETQFSVALRKRSWQCRARTALAVCGWLYLAGALGLWALLRAADLWWPATFEVDPIV